MFLFGFFFERGGSTKRVLAQLPLPQQGFVGQPVGPEVAPPSMLYGHHFIDVRCVEAEWLLRRAVTIVRETSATSSS